MRDALTQALLRVSGNNEFVFLTGDLGFMALEPLRDAMGNRFVNAGISEQNMISMAAGLARSGLRPWAYSIAPFIYTRPLEQIRNDVCFHRLPVVLVGNGGGYAYGVMGPSHHALEDYGVLSTLPEMRCHIPCFAEDLSPLVDSLMTSTTPSYLRLGRDEKPTGWIPPAYAPWRRLTDGQGPLLVAVGPLAGLYLAPILAMDASHRPKLWAAAEFPLSIAPPPSDFWQDLASSRTLVVAEEHVAQGGFGEALASLCLREGRAPGRFLHASAKGYPSGRYGSQGFHRKESGLDLDAILRRLE